MDKFIKIMDFMPGVKSIIGIGAMVGMGICEGLGYHAFNPVTWHAMEAFTGYGIVMKIERLGKR